MLIKGTYTYMYFAYTLEFFWEMIMLSFVITSLYADYELKPKTLSHLL